ncbi:MAG: hypothetical protein FWF31_04570 [Desulfobulbus sp.]|nr:hypothetical protein [Desulfobulbus sp.]
MQIDEVISTLVYLHQPDIDSFPAPIYFGGADSRFKPFFDLMWSLIRSDAPEDEESIRLSPGKAAVLVLTHVEGTGADRANVYRRLVCAIRSR